MIKTIKKIGCEDLGKYGVIFTETEQGMYGILPNDKIEVGLDLTQDTEDYEKTFQVKIERILRK